MKIGGFRLQRPGGSPVGEAALPVEGRADAPVAAAPRHRYLPELALAAGSVAFVILLLMAAEALLRWSEPAYLVERPEGSLAQLHRYSDVYGWEPRPGAVAFVDGQRTTINARGLRGPEHAPARSGQRTRVLLLGDSVAFGYGVADEQTFAARLEARGYEVVNLAVPGYGTDQELLRLEREGIGYEADVLLLHFCLHNDFVDNASRTYFYDGLHPKPFFEVERGDLVLHREHLHLSPLSRLALRLHESSHLFTRLAGKPPPVGEEWSARRDTALADVERVRDLTFRLVARVAHVAHQAGLPMVLVVHPGRRDFREGSPWLDALKQAPALRGIPLVDMGERFRERGLKLHDLTLDPIGHLNADGHREAASVLSSVLPPPRADR